MVAAAASGFLAFVAGAIFPQFVALFAALAAGAAALVVYLLDEKRRLVSAEVAPASLEGLAIATWRADGTLDQCNDAFMSLTGYARSARPSLEAIVGSEVQRSAATDHASFVARTLHRIDGRSVPVIVMVDATSRGLLRTVVIDSPERSEAEQELERAREVLLARIVELERRTANDGIPVPAREKETSVEDLARKLATANAELEAFTYSVAHDLRAPLRTIDGFSRELVSTFSAELGETGQHYIQRIRAGTQRMGALIEALLELSRVSRVELRRDLVDVTALAQSIAGEQQYRLGGDTEVVIADGLVSSSDARLTRVVLENLISNAFKFSSKRAGARVEITADNGKPGGLCVRDNGVGFDMEYAGKLFTPFHRLHTSAEFQGTGIGLAIVQRIVQRHGGTVHAESEMGHGTSIYFTLEPPAEQSAEKEH